MIISLIFTVVPGLFTNKLLTSNDRIVLVYSLVVLFLILDQIIKYKYPGNTQKYQIQIQEEDNTISQPMNNVNN